MVNSISEAYELPVSVRKWFIKRLIEKKNESLENNNLPKDHPFLMSNKK